MNDRRFKKWELSLLLALCLSLGLGTWAQARQSALSANLIRLHVLAVSDDEAEQSIKLKVRDGVLEYIEPKLENASTPAEAQTIIASELDGIKAAAESRAEGRAVTVTLTNEYYPTRDYGSFSLPAGRYESLRVILGEGKGHNWWCVVFPPLCLDAAEVDAMEDGDRALISRDGEHKYGFRIIELWGEICDFFEGL